METKVCQNCKKDFTIEPDDFSFYEKMKVPAPTWCPECRMVRRSLFRNERNLYRRKDAHTGLDIFSGFPAEANVVTYENSYWYSDAWDPTSYGVDYDFSRPFFEQWLELFSKVPLPAKSCTNMVDSDYCNEASECRNSYLCFDTDFIENSAYVVKVTNVKDSFDLHEVIDGELCYEDVMVYKSYRTLFSLDCESCVDVWFSKGLRGCNNCFGCVNLRGKSYYFFNEPLTKEEYEKKVSEFNSRSFQEVSKMFQKAQDFWSKFPVKYNHSLRNLNCTGERIFDSKNVKDSVSVQQGENLRHCQIVILGASNCYDSTILFINVENCYEGVTCGDGSSNIKFSFNCWGEARDLEYCTYSLGASNCFGCVSAYKKQYCILNKQYTKEEYEEILPKIKQHMMDMPYVDEKGRVYKYGEFFPTDFSPLPYNESLAQDYVPIDEKIAEEKGYNWKPINLREFQTSINASDLPDSLDEVTENIFKEVIACLDCKRAYRIIPMEFQFYQRIGLPLPRKCHNCRFLDRYKFINKPKLYKRSCMCESVDHGHENNKCGVTFETSYSPEQRDIVYCEECYQKEIV